MIVMINRGTVINFLSNPAASYIPGFEEFKSEILELMKLESQILVAPESQHIDIKAMEKSINMVSECNTEWACSADSCMVKAHEMLLKLARETVRLSSGGDI